MSKKKPAASEFETWFRAQFRGVPNHDWRNHLLERLDGARYQLAKIEEALAHEEALQAQWTAALWAWQAARKGAGK